MGADPVDRLSPEELDALVDSWTDPARPLSQHLELALADAMHRRARGLPPLRGGDPVPGCSCPACTGVAADAPARVVPIRTRYRRAAYRAPLPVEAARRVPLLDVAERLGLGEPVRAGRELLVRCPLHEDKRPSLRLNVAKQVWHCHPCGAGGDGIALYQRARGLAFVEAVKELAQ